jgi:RNA polymerase sigma-70 factor (ECF subfamily)
MQSESDKQDRYDKEKPDRFLRLLTPVQIRIYAYVLSLWPNRVESEDILQETIMVMWSKFDDYRSGTDFLAWAITIAHYSVMTYRHKSKNVRSRFSEETVELLQNKSPRFLDKLDDRLSALQECMKRLPEKKLIFVRLRYDQGLSAQKIAGRFDISVRAVYKVLAHIHNVLLRCVRQALREEEIQ